MQLDNQVSDFIPTCLSGILIRGNVQLRLLILVIKLLLLRMGLEDSHMSLAYECHSWLKLKLNVSVFFLPSRIFPILERTRILENIPTYSHHDYRSSNFFELHNLHPLHMLYSVISDNIGFYAFYALSFFVLWKVMNIFRIVSFLLVFN